MRRKLNFKRGALALGISGIVVWGASIPFTKLLYKNNIKNDENISISADAEENKEEEKIVNYVGTNEEGKKYTYDAKKVAQKLAKYDYSNDGKKVVFLLM